MRRFLVVLSWLSFLPAAHAAPDGFGHELALARAEAQVVPARALHDLDGLRAGRGGAELGQVLVETSRAHLALGDKDAALAAAGQAETLGRELHDDALLAHAWLARAHVLSGLVHDQDTARELTERAMQLAAATPDVPLQTELQLARGRFAEEDGASPEDALGFVDAAVDRARAAADQDALALALPVQARLRAAAGQYPQALALCDEFLAIARASGVPAQLAQARLAEYGVAARAGNARRAETALDAAITLLKKMDAGDSLVTPLVNLAQLYVHARRYGEAYRASTAALRLARAGGDAERIALASFQLGIVDIYFRDVAAGRALVEHALASLQDDGHVALLLDYGHALDAVGQGDAALVVYRQAGTRSLAAWNQEKRASYQLQRQAREAQRKRDEVAALRHDAVLEAAALRDERRLRTAWALLGALALAAAVVITLLYRRVARANRLLRGQNDQLFVQSTRDALTGLFNRHYFHEHVAARWAAQPDAGGVFLLMDIDRFKSINDTHGHGAGDVVLKIVAARLAGALREQDVLIRWGGEEFLVFLPDVGAAETKQVCARLLGAVSESPIHADAATLTVTISIGFCPALRQADGAALDWERRVHLSDLCLYLAKTEGRNRAFGLAAGSVVDAAALAAMEADLKQAGADGRVQLVGIENAATPGRIEALAA